MTHRICRGAVALVLSSCCCPTSAPASASGTVVPPEPGAAAPIDVGAGPLTGGDGRTYAVIRVAHVLEECSGAGGTHYTFRIDEPGSSPRFVHAGGHGQWPDLQGAGQIPRSAGPAVVVPGPPDPNSGYYVAEIALRQTPYDSDEERDAPGWCLSGLPRYAGGVLRVRPANTRDEAWRMLAELAPLGMPPETVNLVAPGEPEQLAVARLTGSHGSGLALTALEGSAPGTLGAAGARLSAIPGDILVVATARGAITRVLLTEDHASARAWVAAIRRSGWPPAHVLLDDRTTHRHQVPGTVVAGKAGCGPTFVSDPVFLSPSGNADLSLSAPAPSSTAPGDRLVVIATRRFSPDRCGAGLRISRAYLGAASRPGVWAGAEIKPGATPVYE
jgi:hypothetical protein